MNWVAVFYLLAEIALMSAEELGEENCDMDNCIFFAKDYKSWFHNP